MPVPVCGGNSDGAVSIPTIWNVNGTGRGFAPAVRGIHLEDVADPEVARLRQGERDIGLIRAAGVGEAAGQDLRRQKVTGTFPVSGATSATSDGCATAYSARSGFPGDLRKPGQGRLRDVAEHRLAAADAASRSGALLQVRRAG